MSKNDMKDRICTFSKNDLKDLVKTYRIPLDLHPRFPDPEFTMDRDWFSFSKRRNTEDVCMDDGPSSLKKWKNKFFLIDRRAIPDHLTWRHSCLCVSDDLPSDGYDRNDVQFDDNVEMSIYNFTTLPSWSAAKIAKESYHLSLPLLERVPSHTTALATEEVKWALLMLTWPSKKRKLQRRDLEAGANAPELDQAEGTDKTDLADLCAKIEDSLERDEGVSTRVISAPILRLGKKLGAPPSIVVVSASEPSLVGTSAPASTSSRSVVASSRVRNSGAEVMRRQMDPLDCLARSALARDAKPIFRRSLIRRKGILSCFVRRFENLQRGYDALGQENRELRSQRDVAFEEIRKLRSQLTDAKTTSVSLSEELTQTDAKLSEQALTVRDLQNELVPEKFKSQEYKDVAGGLREEVTQFVSSGVESLVRKFLSSDEFHAALAPVASLGINYGVERGLHMGHTDVEFEAAVQKVSNFHVGAKADFDKALNDFPTTPFPFLSKIDAASEGSLSDLFIEELSWEGKDFVLPPFYWRTYVFLSFAPVLRAFSRIVHALAASSGRIPRSIYSWIGVIQVLVASSMIALTSTKLLKLRIISKDFSLYLLVFSLFASYDPSTWLATNFESTIACIFSTFIFAAIFKPASSASYSASLFELAKFNRRA
ncbi:hypothetical protein Tco_0954457 [Tanacetum coccineum]|uniref:Uncharacterized protein n=1 Tax=Tanacetum coccineum TaxID=301880 RepID=A0ABQ5E391_9ASTR